jgi:hypothetical protein
MAGVAEDEMKPEPEKLIPLHGGYRKLKAFQVAQLRISESRMLAALLPKLLWGELRVGAGCQFVGATP